MKRALLSVIALTASYTVISAQAATVYLDGDNSGGQSWDNTEDWSDDSAVSASNDYIVDGTDGNGGAGGLLIRSQNDTDDDTFIGNSLTVDNPGAELALKNGTKTVNIADLRWGGGRLNQATGSSTFTIAGGLDVFDGTEGGIQINGDAGRDIIIASTITGTGDITKTGSAELTFTGTSSTWDGELILTNGTFKFTYGFNQADAILTGTGGTFDINGQDLLFGSGSIDGNAVAGGIYTATELNDLGFAGTTFTGLGTIEIVPEPGSLALLGLGGVFVASRRRRR